MVAVLLSSLLWHCSMPAYDRWQATKWPSLISRKTGFVLRHSSVPMEQESRNAHPGTDDASLLTDPFSIRPGDPAFTETSGTASMRHRV